MAPRLRPQLSDLSHGHSSHGHYLQGLKKQAEKEHQQREIKKKELLKIIEHIQQLRLRILRSFGDRPSTPNHKPFLGLSYASREDFEQVLADPNIPPQYKVQLRNELEQLERAQALAKKAADKHHATHHERGFVKTLRPAPQFDKILANILSFLFESAGLSVDPSIKPGLAPSTGHLSAGMQMHAQLSPAPYAGGMLDSEPVATTDSRADAKAITATHRGSTPRPMPASRAAPTDPFSQPFPSRQRTQDLSVTPTSPSPSRTPKLSTGPAAAPAA